MSIEVCKTAHGAGITLTARRGTSPYVHMGATLGCLLCSLLSCLLYCAACDAAPAAGLPGFPQQAVHVLVPFPPGGTTDALARILAERLSERWRQPVLVENQPGANGIVAAEAASRAPADGYTLLFSPLGPIAINALLYRKLPYTPNSFLPLSLAGTLPSVLAVRSALPATRAPALVALLRAAPEQYTYGSQGVGSTSHLTAVMFEAAAGVRLRHIPYNGSQPALNDLAGGRIDLFFDNISSPLSLHRAGRVRILAVASPRRAPLLPDVPTLDESGLRGFESSAANLLVAPAGMAPALARKIGDAADAAMAEPEVRARLDTLGVDPRVAMNGDAARYVAEQTRRWRKVIEGARIHVD